MRILVIEDDAALASFISDGLRPGVGDVVVAHDGREGLALARDGGFDAIVLDRRLPGIDGMAVLRGVRAARLATPVLMLTALGSLDDRVEGLETGADDYLVKPFALSELVARLKALVRRVRVPESADMLTAGELELDVVGHRVRRGTRVIALQRREFGLLVELARNANEVVTRTMLLERVWNYSFDPRTNIVETHISRLRTKLNEGGEPDLIVTVRGGGYMLRTGEA